MMKKEREKKDQSDRSDPSDQSDPKAAPPGANRDPAKERVKLWIAYDGRPFCGWQSQASNNAVQDHLERALEKLIGGRVPVHGSGRTDAGVHADGQVAHADLPRREWTMERWILAINANLPAEIRVLRAQRAPSDFHARFDAQGKIYHYRIWNAPALHPLEIGRVWHLPGDLDLEAVRAAARPLEGKHDFASFAANRGQPDLDTVRTIRQIAIQRRGPLITLRYEGDGFLYKMVRLLTGALVRCGQGRKPIEWIGELLAATPGVKCQFVAPAEGLALTRVFY